jgi:hypothetical protein
LACAFVIGETIIAGPARRCERFSFRVRLPPVEHRRHHRVPFTEAVVFLRKGGAEHTTGQSTDISLGGMFVQTAAPAPFGAAIEIHLHVPGEPSAFVLPAVVRWTGGGGMGVQFGLLGARETHAITELVAEHEDE